LCESVLGSPKFKKERNIDALWILMSSCWILLDLKIGESCGL